ncbi:MAG: glycosyltransferase [Candidatus Latescibacteria bacterium]|nr:glycosyltransferase [bacterium]MBD3423348.1 glycosyltransferase [Candidatus Latescibacterota bacterium]
MRVMLANSETGMRGGEYQTCALASGLMERGCKVALLSAPGAAISKAAPDGVSLFSARYENPPFLTPLSVRRIVRDWKPDLIHAQTSRAHTHMRLAGALDSLFPPLVVSRRVAFGVSRGLAGFLKYRTGVSRFIAVSEAAASKLKEAGVGESMISVVRSGVDTEKLASADADTELGASFGIREGETVIGTVASFEREKGYPTLMEAAGEVAGRHPDTRFLLQGSGSMEGYIRAQAGRGKLNGRVSLISPEVPLEKVLPLLDIFVLPSYCEGLSTALISAMAAGIPPVASDTGGIPEVLAEGAGILVEPGDSIALATTISALAVDRAERARLSEIARRRASEFDIRKTVKSTYDIYNEITSERGRE